MPAGYRDVLERLDAFAGFETSADPRHVTGQEGIRRLLEDLGRPDRDFRIVHVAGTHGKGTTAAMIAAILASEGESTGLYTSPHVADVRDGIELDGAWISESELARCGARVLEAAESYGGSVALSRFDLMTAIAFLAFSRAEVAWAVVEAGLGGRLDSTNVTDKALAVLTPIDYEHTAILGETLSEIAGHKLGIARPGSPVVLAEQDAALEEEMTRQLERQSGGVLFSRRITLEPTARPDRFVLRWPDGISHGVTFDARFPLRAHLDCFKTALAARLALGEGSARRRAAWAGAASKVRLPGRLSFVDNAAWRGVETPIERLVLDGCHTPAAIRACTRQLEAWGFEGCTLILGLASDKPSPRLARPLGELCRLAQEVVATPFLSPRAGSPSALAAFLRAIDPDLGQRTYRASSLDDAMRTAARSPGRGVVIAGSLYLVRDVLDGLAWTRTC